VDKRWSPKTDILVNTLAGASRVHNTQIQPPNVHVAESEPTIPLKYLDPTRPNPTHGSTHPAVMSGTDWCLDVSSAGHLRGAGRH